MPALDLPPPPPSLHFVLPAFEDLADSRPYANGVPLPIPASEIAAWCEIHGVRLTAFEAGALKILDRCWLKAISEPAQV